MDGLPARTLSQSAIRSTLASGSITVGLLDDGQARRLDVALVAS